MPIFQIIVKNAQVRYLIGWPREKATQSILFFLYAVMYSQQYSFKFLWIQWFLFETLLARTFTTYQKLQTVSLFFLVCSRDISQMCIFKLVFSKIFPTLPGEARPVEKAISNNKAQEGKVYVELIINPVKDIPLQAEES